MARRKVKSLITLREGHPWDPQAAQAADGAEAFLRGIEREYPVRIAVRGESVQVKGPREEVEKVVDIIKDYIERGGEGAFPYPLAEPASARRPDAPGRIAPVLFTTHRGKPIGPASPGQAACVEAMLQHDLVFVVGPAGSGKTYLAVAVACHLLRRKEVARLILTRPAVEAGEQLGFLPGDILSKVEPYFRPLYDALFEMMEADQFHRYMERGLIEVAPLAYMRGRTLGDAFIILDEAQNTTPEQMKMFLTRMGFSARMVVTGDVTQIDLPEGKTSGLLASMDLLRGVEGIGFVQLTNRDVVRHPLVQRILAAYEDAAQEVTGNP